MKWFGAALAVGGALNILVNTVLTPMIGLDGDFVEVASSSLFFWRQGMSCDAAFFLMLGAIGIYRHQSGRAGRMGDIPFGLTFLGCVALFAHEWGQVFYVHPLARASAEGLRALEDAGDMTLYDIGALSALATFTLGWMLFAVSMLRAGVLGRAGPILLLAGFVTVPVMGGAVSEVWGLVVGNVVLGLGWILIAREIITGRARTPDGATS